MQQEFGNANVLRNHILVTRTNNKKEAAHLCSMQPIIQWSCNSDDSLAISCWSKKAADQLFKRISSEVQTSFWSSQKVRSVIAKDLDIAKDLHIVINSQRVFYYPTHALEAIMRHNPSARPVFENFTWPTPQGHNNHSKSPQRDQCNSGQLLQCTKCK